MASTHLLYPLDAASLAPVHERIDRALSCSTESLLGAASRLFARGGKHLRPALVLLSAEATRAAQKPGCETDFSWEPIYDVAAAVELIHVASLIHDDVIDEAALRRGRPSVNAEWGNHAAVLAGDYLFATAFRLLDSHAASGMVTLMTHAIASMCEGEMLQKEQAYDPGVTEEAYLRRIEGKTGALLAACCEAGARLAGADDEVARGFGAYGRKLGLAYQIADDVLDIAGESETLGKPAGSDLKQGILTLPVILLLKDPAWRSRLTPRLMARHIDEATVAAVREAAEKSGALREASELGERLAGEAAEHLRVAGESKAAAALALLSSKAVRRRR